MVTAVNAYGESTESDQVSAVPGVSSAAYTLADLSGNWEVNSLASGPGAPWWIRISLNIAADGSFSGTETDSDGITYPPAEPGDYLKEFIAATFHGNRHQAAQKGVRLRITARKPAHSSVRTT